MVPKIGVQSSVNTYQRLKKRLLDATLLYTLNDKVKIKGKVVQSREWITTLLYTLVLQLLKREPSGNSQLRSPALLTYSFINQLPMI